MLYPSFCFGSPCYFSQIFGLVFFVISADKHSIFVVLIQSLVLHIWWEVVTFDYWQMKGMLYGFSATFPLSILAHRPWHLEGK